MPAKKGKNRQKKRPKNDRTPTPVRDAPSKRRPLPDVVKKRAKVDDASLVKAAAPKRRLSSDDDSGAGESSSSIKPTRKRGRRTMLDDEEREDGHVADDEAEEQQTSEPGEGRRKLRSLPKKPVLGEGLRKTDDVLEKLSAAPVLMVQYGGGQGSFAGDAAVLTLRKSRRLFSLDFGGTKGQQTAADKRRQAEREDAPDNSEESDFVSEDEHRGKGRDIGDNTHKHADHIGKQTDATVAKFDTFLVGTSQPEKIAAKRMTEIQENGEVLFGWTNREGKEKRGNTKLRVRGRAILPDLSELKPSDKDENKRSTGALLTVDTVTAGKRKQTKENRVFTMLSLGDMTPVEGQPAVREVWELDGKQQVDVIKMAHHGSEHNVAAAPLEVVTPGKTALIISGYTMTETKTLLQFIQAKTPAKVFILFNAKKDADVFNTLATGRKLVDEAGKKGVKVILAKDYVVSVGEDGAPSLEATGW